VVVPLQQAARVRNWLLLGLFVAWLAYTRLFWQLTAMRVSLPGCPFLAITGHPCPFCGGTRSFAFFWQGDLGDAMRYYPLIPVLFVGSALAVPVLALGLWSRRDLHLRLPRPVWICGLAVAGLALALSWSLKLTVLPN
jgi:hypothetical protein